MSETEMSATLLFLFCLTYLPTYLRLPVFKMGPKAKVDQRRWRKTTNSHRSGESVESGERELRDVQFPAIPGGRPGDFSEADRRRKAPHPLPSLRGRNLLHLVFYEAH